MARDYLPAAFVVAVVSLVAWWAGTPTWLALCGIAVALVLCIPAVER